MGENINSEALTIDSLTPEELRQVNYIRDSVTFNAILVGALPAKDSKTLNPLVLAERQLYLVRLFQDIDATLKEPIKKVITQSKILNISDCSVSENKFWYVRPYYQNIISDQIDFSSYKAQKIQQSIANLFLQFVAGLRTNYQHGNISISNLAFQEGDLYLLDYGATWAKNATKINAIGAVAEIQTLADLILKYIPNSVLGNYQKLLQRFKTITGTPEELADYIEKEVDRVSALNEQGAIPIHSGKLIQKPKFQKLSSDEIKQIEKPTVEEAVRRLRKSSSLSPKLVESIREQVEKHASEELVGKKVDNKKVANSKPVLDKELNEESGKVNNKARQRKITNKNVETAEPTKSSSLSSFILIILGFMVFTVVSLVIYKKITSNVVLTTASDDEQLDFSSYWNSAIPSRMKIVAKEAVLNSNQKAELVIIESVIKGIDSASINKAFLEIAFNPEWEHELSKEDRKLALAIGLKNLLEGEKLDLINLDEAHAGIILATIVNMPVTGDIGETGRISTRRMAPLPDKYSMAFAELEATGIKTFASPVARAMARILTGNSAVTTLLVYLEDEKNDLHNLAKLRALARIKNEQLNSQLAEVWPQLGGLMQDYAKWFEQDNLGLWQNVKPKDRLALIADIDDAFQADFSQLADLLSFPLANVAYSAQLKLIDTPIFSKFKNMFSKLVGSKELSREQLIGLVLALAEKDIERRDSLVAAWFSSNPKPDFIVKLLATTHDLQEDGFSLEAARYLKNKDWSIKDSELDKLIIHQEFLVRALVYSKLDANDPNQLNVLKNAIKIEKDPKLKEQLDLKINEHLTEKKSQ